MGRGVPGVAVQAGLGVPTKEPSAGLARLNCQLPASGPLFWDELELLLPPHPESIMLASNKTHKLFTYPPNKSSVYSSLFIRPGAQSLCRSLRIVSRSQKDHFMPNCMVRGRCALTGCRKEAPVTQSAPPLA